jgi:hypothetical protein
LTWFLPPPGDEGRQVLFGELPRPLPDQDEAYIPGLNVGKQGPPAHVEPFGGFVHAVEQAGGGGVQAASFAI